MKTFTIPAIAIACALLVSCGASKKAATSADSMQIQQEPEMLAPQAKNLGAKKAKSEAQLYAEDPARTTLRDWAFYNGFPDDDLESIAATNARAKLSESIAMLVSRAIHNYANRYGQQDLGEEGILQRKKLDSKVETNIKSVSKELLVGSRIVISDRYVQKNGTETAYVCVEINPQVVAENIRKNGEIQRAINENEQLKIDFKSKEFEKEMAGSFEELKEAKNEQ